MYFGSLTASALFAGPFPFPDLQKLRSLRGLYLSNNRFSGEIPDGEFSGMNAMKTVQLANNEFTGRIPSSLTELGKLSGLKLQNNLFEGPIPDFSRPIDDVDFANNKLEGPIPVSRVAIIIAAVAGVLLIAIILATIVRRRRRNTGKLQTKTHLRDDANLPIQKAADHSASEIYARGGGGGGEKGKLSFVRTDREKFELEDLLRAPAEVLGSGSFGSSYKAVLITGSVVVRRFRQMSDVGRDEFYGHMTRLGRLSHPNLLPLVAFCNLVFSCSHAQLSCFR